MACHWADGVRRESGSAGRSEYGLLARGRYGKSDKGDAAMFAGMMVGVGVHRLIPAEEPALKKGSM